MPESLPFEVLHGDEGFAFVLADLVDGADVGMIECGCGAGFTLEPFQDLRVRSQTLGQELQGNESAELGVLGFVDHTHAAATKLLHNAVMGDSLIQQTNSLAFGRKENLIISLADGNPKRWRASGTLSAKADGRLIGSTTA
jgi:hypothetical protein